MILRRTIAVASALAVLVVVYDIVSFFRGYWADLSGYWAEPYSFYLTVPLALVGQVTLVYAGISDRAKLLLPGLLASSPLPTLSLLFLVSGIIRIHDAFVPAGLLTIVPVIIAIVSLARGEQSRDESSMGNETPSQADATHRANFCPNCGAEVSPEGSFCQQCGHRLAAGVSPGGASVHQGGNLAVRYNTLAIVAFVISFFVPFIGFFLAFPARNEIRASNGAQKGSGFVKGALILNWIWVGALVIIAIVAATL